MLTEEQIASYQDLGYLGSLRVLSEDEVKKYRAAVDKTCEALGGIVTRLDGTHRFFGWAWDLVAHPRLVGQLQQLLGPDIVLKSTRIFYKHPHSKEFVEWHQDGITERITDARYPAIFLGITETTVENGCLRVVPRSQHAGLIPHQTHAEPVGAHPGWSNGHAVQEELSGVFTSVPSGLEAPVDLELRPGGMSVHQPVVFHGSNENRSDEPRIGLSASYAAAGVIDKRFAVSVVCGTPPRGALIVDAPPSGLPFEDEVAAYRASDFQIHFSKPTDSHARAIEPHTRRLP